MLVLTRRANETITIGDDVEVKVLSVEGSKVRIGITAPTDRRILRGELHDRHNAAAKLEPLALAA